MSTNEPTILPWKEFNAEEHGTWKQLFNRQAESRRSMAVSEFAEGIRQLGFEADRIPDLDKVNNRLRRLTGWEGVPVKGLESGAAFYPMLSHRQYPVGRFIRDAKDLNYTPAPDVFHDLYGHMPFLTNPAYADFCVEFGKRASRYVHDETILEEWGRLFWFTIEFGLLETHQGRRIFGGGILSSYTECAYSLSDKPRVVPFDADAIRDQPYRSDVVQETLFLLPSREALFSCLEKFEKAYSRRDCESP